MRYVGQGHEVTIPFPDAPLGPFSRQGIVDAFNSHIRAAVRACRRRAFARGHQLADGRERTGADARLASARRWKAGGLRDALKGRRPVYFAQYGEYRATPVYDRYQLAPGATVSGPAIVEERESTAVLGPSAVGTRRRVRQPHRQDVA